MGPGGGGNDGAKSDMERVGVSWELELGKLDFRVFFKALKLEFSGVF